MLVNRFWQTCGTVAHGYSEAVSYAQHLHKEYSILFEHGVHIYGPTIMRVDQMLTGGAILAGAGFMGCAVRDMWKGKNVRRGCVLLATGLAAACFGIYNAYNTLTEIDTSSRKMDIIHKGQCLGNSGKAWREADTYCNARGHCVNSLSSSYQVASFDGSYPTISALEQCQKDVPVSFEQASFRSR